MYAGIGMLLIFWVVTPLQSAIIVSDIRNISHIASTSHYPALIPISEQSSTLDMDFMNKAYSILWLGAPVPAFTTRQMALTPYNVTSTEAASLSEATLTAETDAYWTELECKAAMITPKPSVEMDGASSYFNFSNGGDCNATFIVDNEGGGTDQAILFYIPYWFNVDAFQSLQNSCPSSASHEFLAIAADSSNIPATMVAQFCQPSYYTQKVKATVTLSDYRIISTQPSGPRTALTEDAVNITHFEYIIGTGRNEVFRRGDYPTTSAVQQDHKVAQLNVQDLPGIYNMVGFALGNSNISAQEYRDQQKMQQGFEAAHQILFALAISQLQGNMTSNGLGTLNAKVRAIGIVRGFAIAVEVALGLVAIVTLALLLLYWNRPNKLCENPASIADLMQLLPNAKSRDPLFLTSGSLDSIELETKFHGERFLLEHVEADSTTAKVRHVDRVNANNRRTLSRKPIHSRQSTTTIRPLELRRSTGVLFVFVLSSVTILLTVLFQQVTSKGGLPQPTNNDLARQLLLDYLPTAFATLIEPTWVLFNRLLCILQPYEALKTGKALASDSINLRYTSLPPQFVAVRALGAKHWLLASVCTTALLANVLAVALSSIFQINVISVSQPYTFGQKTAPLLTGQLLPADLNTTELYQEELLDHYYLLKSNYTDRASLPSWTTPNLYFVPFEVEPVRGENVFYEAATRAFGVSSTCQVVSSTAGPNEIDLHLSPNGSYFGFSPSPVAKDSSLASCLATDLETQFALYSQPQTFGAPNGYVSCESVLHLVQCGDYLVTSWFHASFSNDTTASEWKSLDYLVLACEAKLISAEFTTSVDSIGYITAIEQNGPVTTDITQYLGSNITEDAIVSRLNKLMTFAGSSSDSIWHNDSFAGEYFNYVLKPLVNDTNTSPLTPVSQASLMVPLVEQLHTTIFAILLTLTPTAFADHVNQAHRIPGKAYSDQHRVFMNPAMTILALSVLVLNIIVAVFLYARRPGIFLPRMPSSVASILGFVGSAWELGAERPSGVSRRDEQDQVRWGFGKFMGQDGKIKIGIERWPYVQPLVKGEMERKVDRARRAGWWKSWWISDAPPPVPDKDG